MKKYLLTYGLILLCTISACIAGSSAFNTSLINCTPFNDHGTFTSEGNNIQFYKQIIGWEHDKCVYKEKINYSGMEICVTCNLTRNQLRELASTINDIQYYDKLTVQSVQQEPFVQIWNKFLQDPKTCKLGTAE